MQQQEIFRQVAASEREKDRVLPNEVLQRKGLAYRREKRTSWKPRGWKVKAKKDWQSVRKLRSENREQEKQAEVEKEQVQQVDTPQHEEPAYRRPKRPSVQPNGWKIKTKKDWQSVRKLRKEQEKETQQVANKQPSAVLHRLDLSETPFHPRTHHDRLRRDETHSHHYAENVRTIRDKRTLYDERNRQSREGKLLPERAFEPWQEKVLERSFHVEEEKAQPVYLRALLFSRESAVRTSDGLFVPEYAYRTASSRTTTQKAGTTTTRVRIWK